jgi:hypothetical protein
MSRLTNESARMPDRERFAPEEPKKGRIVNPGDLLKRFIMGMIGSCLFSAIMFFVQIKAFIAIILAAILAFLGWGVHPPQEVKDAGHDLGVRIEKKVKDHLPAAGVVGVPNGNLIHRSPEQLKADAELKEAERREESEMKTLIARAEALDLEFEDDWTLEKFRVEVPRAEHEAKEAALKKPLLARADKIGLQVDPTADSKTLRHQVEEGEKEAAADAEYQARLRHYERAKEEWRNRVATGPNAHCPNPKCRHTMRFNPSRIGTQFLCSSCNGVFPVRMAMARWTPPPPPKEPLPPKKNPGLWKRIFG